LRGFGLNRLSEQKQETVWDIFLEEVREPTILLLLITGAATRSGVSQATH